MSPSEEAAKLSALLADLRVQIERTMQAGELASMTREDVTNLVTEAVKLYAAYAEELEAEIPAIDPRFRPRKRWWSPAPCCARST